MISDSGGVGMGGEGGRGATAPQYYRWRGTAPPPPKKKYEQYIESKTKHQAITCHCSVMSAISLLLADCYLMHMFNLMTEGLNFVAITYYCSCPPPPDKFSIPTPLDICFINVQKFSSDCLQCHSVAYITQVSDMTMVVQPYLLKLRETGRVVSACIVVAAARGIVMAYDKFKLEEFDGYIELNRPWANPLLGWMEFVQ